MKLYPSTCEICGATGPDHIIYCVVHDRGEGIRPKNEQICKKCFEKRIKAKIGGILAINHKPGRPFGTTKPGRKQQLGIRIKPACIAWLKRQPMGISPTIERLIEREMKND